MDCSFTCCRICSAFPRLNIASGTKRCGKTTLLRVIEAMVPKALRTDNATVPSIFRIVEASRPSLLIDEADNFAEHNDELRKLVNAGFESGGGVLRTVELKGQHEVRQFAVYCATVLSGIGKLPTTIEDRAIQIKLQRHTREEYIERLRSDRRHHLVDLGRKAARWVADHRDDLGDADPEMPEALGDREQDKWPPLIAIADIAGGTGPPGRARLAW